MTIRLKNDSFFVLDLDDTLYPEIEFLKSGYRFIANSILKGGDEIYEMMLQKYCNNENVFKWIVESEAWDPQITIVKLLTDYRNHFPDIELYPDAKLFLDKLKQRRVGVGLMTDGRSITQRNKIRALGLESYFDHILVSEEFGSSKPSDKNYRIFEKLFPHREFIFVGDNLVKDFVTANRLGWTTIGMKDRGANIHRQSPVDFLFYPNHFVDTFNDIEFDVEQ